MNISLGRPRYQHPSCPFRAARNWECHLRRWMVGYMTGLRGFELVISSQAASRTVGFAARVEGGRSEPSAEDSHPAPWLFEGGRWEPSAED